MMTSSLCTRLILVLMLCVTGPVWAQPASPPDAKRTPVPASLTESDPGGAPLRSAVRIAQPLTVVRGQSLREAVVVMGDARIDGTVTGEVVVILGNLELGPDARVGADVVVVGGEARVAPNARIGGDMVVVLGQAVLPPEASVTGETAIIGTAALGDSLQALVPWLTRGLLLGRPLVPDIRWVWMVFGAFLLIQLFVHLLAHDTVTQVTATVINRPLTSLLTGLAVLTAWGPVSVLLAITVVGLVVLPFAGLALLAGGLVGRVAVARAIGLGVWAADDPGARGAALRSFVAGSGVITVAYLIPVVGLTAYALISLASVGAAVLTIVEVWRRERPKPMAPEPPPMSAGAALSRDQSMAAAPPIPPVPPPSPLTEGAEAVAVPPVPPVPPIPPVSVQMSAAPAAAATPTDAPASLLRYRRASLLERGAALVIDLVLLAVVASSFDWLLPPILDDSLLGFLVYFTGFWWLKASTPGGMVMGLRVARLNGERLTLLDAGLRSLVGVVSFVPLGAGVLWILREPERQAWHDLALGTVVVSVPKDMVA